MGETALPTGLFSSLPRSEERQALRSTAKDTLKILKTRLNPGLAVWSSKAELNRCLWLIEAHGMMALSLRAWRDVRPQGSPPARDRQTGRRAAGRASAAPMGLLSSFRNAQLLSQNCLTGKLSSTSIMQFSHQNYRRCLKRNKKRLNLKCVCATPSSCGSVNGLQIPPLAVK